MHKIKVTTPFSLRLDSESPVREFPLGDHIISDDELAHWFIQGSLDDGRAILVPMEEEDSGELVAPTKDELMKLKVDQLKALCDACGTTPPEGAAKAVMADLLLAGCEGFTLVKGPDGIYVEKAKAE